ncbi:hypothetical protein CLV49_1417 [Labedella gwakjiensis]|uniref:Uncharacterized protein n=1 Tax=Labedella gwakjiensis TaxID=390269 RepID=A0A2P8GV15_9MICO|nr:hypothetical protein [Labedella gwakjiensis]PSL37810.1 hypothetical protein CLV49_1417 [Labedella gwakjiensis]
MDPLAGLALTVVFAAVALYTLYWVIRRAVAGGIRDAREQPSDPASPQEDVPEAG